MMPERLQSDQVSLSNQPENQATFTSKAQENHGLYTDS